MTTVLLGGPRPFDGATWLRLLAAEKASDPFSLRGDPGSERADSANDACP